VSKCQWAQEQTPAANTPLTSFQTLINKSKTCNEEFGTDINKSLDCIKQIDQSGTSGSTASNILRAAYLFRARKSYYCPSDLYRYQIQKQVVRGANVNGLWKTLAVLRLGSKCSRKNHRATKFMLQNHRATKITERFLDMFIIEK